MNKIRSCLKTHSDSVLQKSSDGLSRIMRQTKTNVEIMWFSLFAGFTQSDSVFNVFPGSREASACCQPSFGTTVAQTRLFLTDHQRAARGEVTLMEMRMNTHGDISGHGAVCVDAQMSLACKYQNSTSGLNPTGISSVHAF